MPCRRVLYIAVCVSSVLHFHARRQARGESAAETKTLGELSERRKLTRSARRATARHDGGKAEPEENLVASGKHKEPLPLCEDQGLELPDALHQQLDRPLTESELQESFERAGLLKTGATNGTLTATWVVGPSAAGKSLVAHALLREQESLAPVIIEGELFRDAHGGYQAAMWNGLYQQSVPCMWEDAWNIVRPYRLSWREQVLQQASREKRHVIFLESCTQVQACADNIQSLKEAGYVNNIVGVTAKESVVAVRRIERARVIGKRFDLSESSYRQSMYALAPLIEVANGWYKIIDNSLTLDPTAIERCERFGKCIEKTLAEGTCFNAKSYPAWASLQSEVNELRDTIEEFVADIEQHDSGAHLPSCESLDAEPTERAMASLSAEFTSEEKERLDEKSQIGTATSQEKPVALWILGAAAVGKSTTVLSSHFPGEAGLKLMGTGEASWDAVVVDGESYWQFHSGLGQVVREGKSHSPPCVFHDSWNSTDARKHVQEQENRIFREASSARKNIIIISSCAPDVEACVAKVHTLKESGYTNHIIATTAKGSIIDSRGRSRADFEGRAYSSNMQASIDAFLPMIASINGAWELIDNTGAPMSIARGSGGDTSHACAVALKDANPYLAPDSSFKGLCPLSLSDMLDIQKLVHKHQERIEGRLSVTDHLPVCEDLGIALPAAMIDDMNRDITADERDKALLKSGVSVATEQEQPIAVWLLGASAVGKSTASKTLLEQYGIPNVRDSSGKLRPNAVQVDAEILRSVHGGFQAAVQHGLEQSPPCMFREGRRKGTKMRSACGEYKKATFLNAVDGRRHLIIPATCASDLATCISSLEHLKANGYTNHVVAIYAREKLVKERGQSRADKDGKIYVPVNDNAVFAFAPMIAAANGQCTLIDNSGNAQRQSTDCLSLEVSSTEAVEFEHKMNGIVRSISDMGSPYGADSFMLHR